MSDQNIASFFADPAASDAVSLAAQQIAAPVVNGQTLTDDEMMGSGGALRVVYLVLDRSPSMEEVADDLIGGFNNDFVPAIQDARGDDIAALRFGAMTFSSDITPIWNVNGVSLHGLDDIPSLEQADYNPSRGSGTALHQAIIDGTAAAVRYAADIRAQNGIQPEVDVIYLTDGRNNCSPRDVTLPRQIITGGQKDLVRHTFLYFETGYGASDPANIAQELGFDMENVMVFGAKPGESDTDRAKRFRRMMQVMSKVSASKGNSAVNAAAAADDII